MSPRGRGFLQLISLVDAGLMFAFRGETWICYSFWIYTTSLLPLPPYDDIYLSPKALGKSYVYTLFQFDSSALDLTLKNPLVVPYSLWFNLEWSVPFLKM